MNLKKFGAGLIVQVGVKILAAGLGFFSTRWLITTLSVQDYSTYNLILAYNATLLMGLWFGVPHIIQKYYTNEQDTEKLKNFWTTFAVFRFGTYFVGLAIILLTFRLSQTNELGLIIGLYTAQFILIADFAYRSVCDALGTAWKFSITDFLGKFILVVLLYTLSALSITNNFLVLFILLSIGSYTFALILDSLWHRKYTRFGSFDISILKKNARPITFLSISYVSYALYYTTVPLFIKYFGFGEITVNSYSNAYKFFEIATIVPGLTMPTIASMVKKRIDSENLVLPFHKVFSKEGFIASNIKKLIYIEWWFVTLAIGLCTGLGLFIFGPFAIRLIDPDLLYPEAIPALRLIAIIHIPQSIMYMTTVLNVLYDGERFDMYASIVLAILAITLYVTLIPLYGLYGGIIALISVFTVDFFIKFGIFYFRVLRNNT
jgi:O-antigen/teichoic acid export membrane protein